MSGHRPFGEIENHLEYKSLKAIARHAKSVAGRRARIATVNGTHKIHYYGSGIWYFDVDVEINGIPFSAHVQCRRYPNQPLWWARVECVRFLPRFGAAGGALDFKRDWPRMVANWEAQAHRAVAVPCS